MDPISRPTAPPADDAQAPRGRPEAEAESMQAVLVRLLQDVVRAESRLDQAQAPTLAAVNEQLVLAALTSQAEVAATARALDEAAQIARLDPLTELPNRRALADQFSQAAAFSRRHFSGCALLYLDLDDFKRINDTHGHAFGDRALQLVARRLAAAVREIDTVSRLGGDEFLVLLSELTQKADATAVAEKLQAAVAAPAEIDGRPVQLGVSVGIAVYPDDGDDIDTLIARADAAMYAAKRRRGERHAPPPDAGAEAPTPNGGAAPDDTALDRRLADLREANEKLVLATLDARELQAAAEQALQRQRAFLHAVADELRDPKAPIRIAAAMLGRSNVEESLLPQVQHIVGQQIAKISHLIEAVNAENNGLALAHRRVDLGALIDATVASNRHLFEARGQRLEVRRAPGAIDVIGDAERLGQVIVNLLDNAARHTQDGGRIQVVAEVDERQVKLAVSDNGIGITPQQLPRVFEPFAQDPRTLGLDGIGLGVGLTAARALVRAHGGEISAHSDGASRGSRFVVTLPLADSAPSMRPAPPPGA